VKFVRPTNIARELACALLLAALSPWATSALAQDLAPEPTIDSLWHDYASRLPKMPRDFLRPAAAGLKAPADKIEKAVARRAWQNDRVASKEAIETVRELIDIQTQADDALNALIAVRGSLTLLQPEATRRAALQEFLQVTSQTIDLAGRLRYQLHNAIENAAFVCAREEKQRVALIDLLIERKVSVGANAMIVLLFDPAPGELGFAAQPETKAKVLELVAASGDISLVPDLADFIVDPQTPPTLVLQAVNALRYLGIPQTPHPLTPKDVPVPAITAMDLYKRVLAIDAKQLPPEWVNWRKQFLDWLGQRSQHGVLSEDIRLGHLRVQPGDWLLMRNPSPYNRGTDLDPGLFTHVGVVVADVGGDGIRRMVIVDLPERGDRMPATNVETYVTQSLHYCFVRHPDPKIAARIAESAKQTIGNETEFDLTFQTKRVAAYKGKSLKNARISTYCAGFLLLCAQDSGAPIEDFFPVREHVASGPTAANMARLGLSIGDEFVSPTGPLFSPKLKFLGQLPPLYDPGREVREAIYDDFSASLRSENLIPAPNLWQSMRGRLAEISKTNPWLARALASRSNVSPFMDLEAAAKAAVVVETLDEIADTARTDFEDAWEAIQDYVSPPNSVVTPPAPGPGLAPAAPMEDPRVTARRKDLLTRHQEVADGYRAGKLAPFEVRMTLVRYYADAGRRQIRQRFFPEAK